MGVIILEIDARLLVEVGVVVGIVGSCVLGGSFRSIEERSNNEMR